MDAEDCERMRADWNRRAREDANYYVAFGRRQQNEEEFQATALAVVRDDLLPELKRLPPERPGARRALEIGCGPGRLMAPLAWQFGEIHGVDISGEMIRLARARLEKIPHAHTHVGSGADLAAFADDWFDFVYSYAVFQHIPNRDVVFRYLREARRVLKAGGILRFQVNGLPVTAARYDTWNGVRIAAGELAAFARDHDFQLLALQGDLTQYLWATMRKQPEGWRARLRPAACPARIRRITNARSSEPVVCCRGLFSAASLWLEGLAPECDLNSLEVLVAGAGACLSYLGPPETDGLQQLNFWLRPSDTTGLQPFDLRWLGELLATGILRVIPPGPMVPRLVSVTDGIDLLSDRRIVSGLLKVSVEEVADPEAFRASWAGMDLELLESFCLDPRLRRFDFNFRLPGPIRAGRGEIGFRLGSRRFPPMVIEVA